MPTLLSPKTAIDWNSSEHDNIDEALQNFCGTVPIEHFGSVVFEDRKDWLLDGVPGLEVEIRRTEELLRQLHAPPVISHDCASPPEVVLDEASMVEDGDWGDFMSATASCETEINTQVLIQEADAILERCRPVATPTSVDVPGVPPIPFSDLTVPRSMSDRDTLDVASSPLVPRHLGSSQLPLSCRIPLTDLTTLEARFTLRRQRRNQLEPLEERFGLPNVDVAKILKEAIPFWFESPCDDPPLAEWDDDIAQRLSWLDDNLSTVKSSVALQLGTHLGALDEANQTLFAFDANCRLATMYRDRASYALSSAQNVVSNHKKLLWSWEQRENCERLREVLDEVGDILMEESNLMATLDSWDPCKTNALKQFENLLRDAPVIRERASSGSLSSVRALDEARQRLDRIDDRVWGRWTHLVRLAIHDLCHGLGDGFGLYSGLIESCKVLYADGQNDDWISLWSGLVEQAFISEIDFSLATALVNTETRRGCTHRVIELQALAADVLNDNEEGIMRVEEFTCDLMSVVLGSGSTRTLAIVIKQLCNSLSDSLFAFHDLVNFHESLRERSDMTADRTVAFPMEGIVAAMRRLMKPLWIRCEKVVIQCLDDYMSVSQKQPIFDSSGDLGMWAQDIQNLSDLQRLVDALHEVAGLWFGDSHVSVVSDEVQEKLACIYRRHIRSIHVEAMNSLGRMLSEEIWQLVPPLAVEPEQTSNSELLADDIMASSVLGASYSGVVSSVATSLDVRKARFAHWIGDRDSRPFRSVKSLDVRLGPVLSMTEVRSSRADVLSSFSWKEEFLHLLSTGDASATSRFAPRSFVNGLLKWTTCLLHVHQTLPQTLCDLEAVFSNLFDLYCSTVLRLCAGDAPRESILLGGTCLQRRAERRRDDVLNDGKSSRSSRVSARSRRDDSKRVLDADIPVLDAILCSPMVPDRIAIDSLRDFIERAHESLNGVVKLDKVDNWLVDPRYSGESPEEYACMLAKTLEKRLVASWSCLAVASLAACVGSVTCIENSSKGDSLNAVCSYLQSVMDNSLSLWRVSSRIAVARSLAPSEIVKAILNVGGVWEECKLNEESNGYVESVCLRCSLVWGFLAASGKLHSPMLQYAWREMQRTIFLALLDGFVRIPCCSTEGRALMTLDLYTLSAGLRPTSVSRRLESHGLGFSPPDCSRDDLRYVDSFVKVFYYPREDAMEWVRSHYSEYYESHTLALLESVALNPEQSPEGSVHLIREQIRKLYASKSV